MLLKILNFFIGYISVKASGGFGERFINLCSVRGIHIWEISYVGDDMFFFARAENYREIKKIAKSAGMDIRVHGRFGVHFFISRNRARVALTAGTVFILCFIAFMSTRVWSVCVTGNENVFDSEIISEFEKLGFKIGMRKKSIDIIEVQNKFLSDMGDKIIWVSLNLEGMCAEIQVRETKKAQDSTDGKPCNIVASFDGTIKSMKTFSGTPVESVKNGVKEGDLLISGIVEYYDGALDFVEARGEITAEHTVKIESDLNKATARKYVGLKEYGKASVFGMDISLGKRSKEESELTERKSSAVLNGVTLPFFMTNFTQSFYEPTEPDDSLRRKYLIAEYMNSLEAVTANSDVISVKSRLSGKGKNMKISGEIICVDFVGKSVPINIKKE